MDKPVAFVPSPATLCSVDYGNDELKVSNESSLQASIHIEPIDRSDLIYAAENRNHQFIMSTLRETQEESSDSQSYFKAAIHFQQSPPPNNETRLSKHYRKSIL